MHLFDLFLTFNNLRQTYDDMEDSYKLKTVSDIDT